MKAGKVTLAVLAIGLFVNAAAPATTFLVVESRGDAAGRFPKGTLLEGGSEMDLPASSELVLLSEAGELRTMRGPAKGIANPDSSASGSPKALKSLADMLTVQKDGRVTPGAVRGSGPRRATDPWVVDTTSAGTKCIFEDRPAVLWRSGALPAMRVSLEAVASKDKAVFDWPARAATIAWPSEVPRKTGQTYVLSSGAGAEWAFTLAVAPGESTPGRALLFMAESQCVDQAALLLAQLSKPTAKK